MRASISKKSVAEWNHFARQIGELDNEVNDAYARACPRHANNVVSKARALAPKLTGRLAASIYWRPINEGAELVSPLDYSRISEFGGWHPVYGNLSNWTRHPRRPHIGYAVETEWYSMLQSGQESVTRAAAKVGFRD
jgi:hypothetical protein